MSSKPFEVHVSITELSTLVQAESLMGDATEKGEKWVVGFL